MDLSRTAKSLQGTAAALAAVLVLGGCSLFATRPVQEMSDTAAALRAAREVQADVLAPDLFRQSNEWFLKARHDYKLKNFKTAREFAEKARGLAEQAEFEALKSGALRSESGANADAFAPLPSVTETQAAEPYPYPVPEPKPASDNPEMGANPPALPAPLPATTPSPGPVPPGV